MERKRLIAHTLIIGMALGMLVTSVAFYFDSKREWVRWRCLEFSPVTGRCTLMESVDRIKPNPPEDVTVR